jgi:predicted dehydrogenase
MSEKPMEMPNGANETPDLTRRDFIKTAGAAASVALAAGCTTVTRKPVVGAAARKIGPNEKINVAVIGVGGRGTSLLRQVVGMEDQCRVIAVCDVYQRRVNRAKNICAERNQPDVKTCEFYTDVLAMADVDAVIIATPDHWHAPIAIAAMEAGKDVYCEKPMTHTIEEARQMAETEKRLGRIVQVGSQTTSGDQWWNAKKAIEDGMIGDLLLSQGSYHRNSKGGEWNYGIDENAGPDKTGDDHINWDLWQQPAEHKFAWTAASPTGLVEGPQRFFRFRKYWDYSGGIATDLFFHVMAPLNICWPEPQFPWRASGMGGIYAFDDGREVPDTFMLAADYPGGHSVVLSSSMANATHIPGLIRGHEGTITMVEHGQFEGSTPFITVRPEDRLEESAKAFVDKWGGKEVKIPTKARPSHMQNFFDCIRSREETVLSARKGYRVQVAITLAVDSYRQGKVLYFDEKVEKPTDRRPSYTIGYNTPGWLKDDAVRMAKLQKV